MRHLARQWNMDFDIEYRIELAVLARTSEKCE